MINNINITLEAYEQQWQKLIAVRHDRQFFAELRPNAVGWNTTNRDEYNALIAEIRNQSDFIIETLVQDNWMVTIHFKDTPLANGAEIMTIRHCQPDLTDGAGLDHVDFYSPEVVHAESYLQGEKDLEWTWEKSNVQDKYNWISLRFDNNKAQLRTDTALNFIQAHLKRINQEIIHI